MAHLKTERLSGVLGRLQDRRSFALLAAALSAALLSPAEAREKSPLERRRKRAERRSERRNGGRKRSRKGRKKAKGTGFPASCEEFLISAGPSTADRFKHIDDDLLIELLPARGTPRVLFKDDNDLPNGPGGSHPTVDPFTAKVGDRIRIVARNEVAGGCELDAIWLHCLEGKGGSVKLLDAVTPKKCKKNANAVGVFVDTTVRIRNK